MEQTPKLNFESSSGITLPIANPKFPVTYANIKNSQRPIESCGSALRETKKKWTHARSVKPKKTTQHPKLSATLLDRITETSEVVNIDASAIVTADNGKLGAQQQQRQHQIKST